MRILITGGSGFVGQLLCQRLHQAGHALLVVSRRPENTRALLPEGCDVRDSVMAFAAARPEGIINLAGEPIAGKRWSEAQKYRLRESRVAITDQLVELCQTLETPPEVLISGSAMGYYGDQGSRDVTEQTPPHDEFAHRLCADWESAAQEAESLGVRVALLRTGLVLDAGGGTLAKLQWPFKLGLGGRLGSGRQYMPWVHREDLVRIILFLLERKTLVGPFNGSAPHPVTNAEFTRTLARHLHRPALFTVPAFMLEQGLGEMSRLLLTGARMYPARLEDAGFSFRYPTLDAALDAILGD
ncbi:TIGR01777 family oxidoreductase [Halomonas sp. WWR20]